MGRTPKAKGGLEALKSLRGKLDPDSAPARKQATDAQRAPARETPPQRPATEDGTADLRAALRDVKPIRNNQRAELERPKPPPLPRPRPRESEPAPARTGLTNLAATSGPELFRAMMSDVTPLKDAHRIELLRARPHLRPHSDTSDERGDIAFGPPLLPPNPDRLSPEELFLYANRGTRPIDRHNRAHIESTPPSTEPIKRSEDERATLRDAMEQPMSFEDRLDAGDEAAFLRHGLPRRVLTDLRRGRWVLQGELDLHGLNRDEARLALGGFLAASVQRGRRCVRVIHGKGLGSPGRESILKQLSRNWLAQREEILAFCQAGPNQGGSGALMVLLRGPAAASR
ncbi:MAG: Smr/MutS family protein [Rhodocyclales bacterium]|nr:Smr/MutS family protein [Rhodocyclales bacterium]